MALLDRVRAATSAFLNPQVRSPKVHPGNPQQSYLGLSSGGGPQSKWDLIGTRKGAITLRRFSERNVWVRVAINRRKRELAGAKWKIVRIDDPKKQPDQKIVDKISELLTFVNDTKASFHWLVSTAVEDILVFDAAVWEKEKTAGGDIAALWPIDGSEIMPINGWDGSNPKSPRYVQIRNGKEIMRYLNDELVYMMANPRSNSPIGMSPLEVLVATVEADLYGEYFEYQLMKETAPAGLLYLGTAVSPEKVEAFREQWEADIAGTRDIAILGTGGYDPDLGHAVPPSFTPFSRSGRDEQRREYMKWLATKVASAFEMDLMAFNLSEAVHRSIGENLQQKTDEGLIGLAKVFEAYVTREILWEFDPDRRHAFQFQDLIPTDDLRQAKVDQIRMATGVTFPNEIRARDGEDEVPWGAVPWIPAAKAFTDEPNDDGQPQDEPDQKKPGDDQDDDQDEDDK